MTKISVELEDNLPAGQVAKIKDSINMIKGVVRVSGDDSYQLAALHRPESGESLDFPQGQGQNINLDSISPGQKRHIISQAIAWGSKHGKITLKSLERLNPEEILSLATKCLGEMSDAEKDVIFNGMT